MLVIGQGSIGVRHARVARELGADVAVVTRRQDVEGPRFPSIAEVTGLPPDVVIIANETGRHRSTLAAVGERWPATRVLVEKPLFARDEPLPPNTPRDTFVGYCLRFHPVVQALVEALRDKRLYSIHAVVGQHLSLWRPGTDYRQSYSARAAEGGALRDLSHELDLVQLLAGSWRRVAALVGHVSDLETEADDCASLLLECERCKHVTVHVDMIDRAPRRGVVIHAEHATLELDLIASTFTIDSVIRVIPVMQDAMYVAQMIAVMNGDAMWLCGAVEATRTASLIDAAERSSSDASWQYAA